MHVPAHFQEIASTLALRSWVASKSCPREGYFETIDGAKLLLARHQPADPEDPRHELLATVLAAAIDHEGCLLTHVLECATYSLDSEDRDMRWLRACQAAAWVLLQAYELACKKGEWPR